MSSIETEKLKQSLMEDLTQAQARVTQTAEASGVEETGKFMPKALRIKGRVIAEKELSDLSTAFDDAVNKLASEASFLNAAEEGKFKLGMRQKLNAVALSMIEKSGMTQREISKMKLDQQKSDALIGMIGGMAGTIGSGIIKNVMSKGAYDQVASNYGELAGEPEFNITTPAGGSPSLTGREPGGPTFFEKSPKSQFGTGPLF